MEWVNLQFGDWEKEVEVINEEHGIQITHLENCSASGDFNQYGSLIANLDLVISAGNAALMLATSLGIKSFLFLPGFDEKIDRNYIKGLPTINNTYNFYKGSDKNWSEVVDQICNEIRVL